MGKRAIKLKKLLCPLDLSEFSCHALDYAVTLAEQYQGIIYVIYVIPNFIYSDSLSHYWVGSIDLDKLEKESREKLQAICDERISPELQYEITIFKDNVPAKAISDYAKEKEVDLIVIATHGYSGLDHFILGSTAEKTMRMAPCPVLAIKHPEHDFIISEEKK